MTADKGDGKRHHDNANGRVHHKAARPVPADGGAHLLICENLADFCLFFRERIRAGGQKQVCFAGENAFEVHIIDLLHGLVVADAADALKFLNRLVKTVADLEFLVVEF